MRVWIVAMLARRGGSRLEKTVPAKKLERLKRVISSHAAWAVLVASVLPPPFPLTPVVAGAAALQYPLPKLLGVLAVGRALRFTLLAYLALRYGRQILRWANSPAVHWFVGVLIVVSVAGSAWTVWSKLHRR